MVGKLRWKASAHFASLDTCRKKKLRLGIVLVSVETNDKGIQDGSSLGRLNRLGGLRIRVLQDLRRLTSSRFES